jgi:hypothetical protein
MRAASMTGHRRTRGVRVSLFAIAGLFLITAPALADDQPIVVRSNGFTITIDIRKDGTAGDVTVRKAKPKATKKQAKRSTKAKTVTVSKRTKRKINGPVVVTADRGLVPPFAEYGTLSAGFRTYNAYAIPPSWRPTSPDWKLLW